MFNWWTDDIEQYKDGFQIVCIIDNVKENLMFSWGSTPYLSTEKGPINYAIGTNVYKKASTTAPSSNSLELTGDGCAPAPGPPAAAKYIHSDGTHWKLGDKDKQIFSTSSQTEKKGVFAPVLDE